MQGSKYIKMDKISVIIPAYNAQDTIKKCLSSILTNRTDGKFDLEVVVVNDGSKDKTKDIIEEIAKSDTRVVLLNQNNQGPSAARKNGVKNSTGDYLAFCDSDDWVEPDWLLCLYNILIENCADISVIRSIYSRTENDRGTSNLYVWKREEALQSFLRRDRINGSLVVKMFNRSLFDGLQWDPTMKYFEDDILMWQMLQKCNKVVKLDSGKYHIELSDGSLTASKFNQNRLISTNKLFDRIFNDCQKSDMRKFIPAAMDFRYFVFNAHFRMMFKDDFEVGDEGLKMHHAIRESGIKKAFQERGLINKVFAIALYVSPSFARMIYKIK